MKISYYDSKVEIRLEAYADTIVLNKDNPGASILVAIRFGGYPESVRALAEAIYGGGDITVETNDGMMSVRSMVKQYRKEYSHDGVYAEATLLINDDRQHADTEPEKEKAVELPRRCYIFCEQGDDNRLFEEIDKKTAVPLIPEFKDYVLNELQGRKILTPLKVISFREKFDVWGLSLDKDEKNIIAVINDGLTNGIITIPGASQDNGAFDEIGSVSQYLNAFGVTVAERIRNQFLPLFDPAAESLSRDVLAVNESIRRMAGYSLYDAQLAVAESLKRCLEKKKFALCIAECGSGKTKIGAAALHAYQMKTKADKHFNVVICPSHLTKKWVREIEESLPDTFAVVVGSITELLKVYRAYENDTKTCYAIMSKEKARDGYMKRPAAMYNKRKDAFVCPDCGAVIQMDLIADGTKYTVNADQFFFQKENHKNHKCESCGSLLWTILTPGGQSEWVKISEYGFIHRRLAYQHCTVAKKPATLDAIDQIAENPDGRFSTAGAYDRFPLSTFIKEKMRGKIDGLIIDELHNFNRDSGQGDAMAELFDAAKKVIGMTATLINGYSSGIFHLLYRIAPHLMKRDAKDYEKPKDFDEEYGVVERVFELDSAEYNSNRRSSRRKLRERQLPGVSPLVYSRFLIENAAFLSLNDMGKNLPEYEEFPVELQMKREVEDEYNRVEKEFIGILRDQKEIAKKVLSSYLGLLTVYPDQPYGHKPVVHPITGDDLVVPKDKSDFDELHEKDLKTLEIVEKKIGKDERVLIYTSWVRIDTQDKLFKLLTENGYRVSVLSASVSPNKREEWVEKQVRSGVQVLIANPSLLETGLDLNDFTTLIYYNVGYNLFTLRQSSRRSWRINQRAPRIEVYFLYYHDTMQHRAVRLMASKLAVAGIIEGNLTDEGLAAMSECQDLTTALARELTLGIKNEVDDLGAVFKRMAILRPLGETFEPHITETEDLSMSDTVIVPLNSEVITPLDITSEPKTSQTTSNSFTFESFAFMSNQRTKTAKQVKSTKPKHSAVITGQISLFELLSETA